MRVPLLDLREQYRALVEPIHEAIEAVLASQRFILGPQVEAFEKAIRAYCDARNAIGVSSGTDARSEEHTSELQSRRDLVCRLLLEKKKTQLEELAFVHMHAEWFDLRNQDV